MKTPSWWSGDGLMAKVLTPLGGLCGAITRHRLSQKGTKVAVPVICIGNITAGGTGKTPVTMALAEMLNDLGQVPHIISRGYGGQITASTRVDPALHDAAMVGDEPMLLARAAPTWVGRDRVASAQMAIKAGATLLLLDDGFQNPQLVKDISLLVVDGPFGFGNCRLIPAGPCREPVLDGLARADGVILVGDDPKDLATKLKLPVWRAHLTPKEPNRWLDRDVIAFAGIGRPEKFFATLQQMGANLRSAYAFADHYAFQPRDLDPLLAEAQNCGACLLCTEKDWVKLPLSYRRDIHAVPVRLDFLDASDLMMLLKRTCQ